MQQQAQTGVAPPGTGTPGNGGGEPSKPADGTVQPGNGTPGAIVPLATGTAAAHACDICAKSFPFRYQLIVHRRYHTERKPFTCQVGEIKYDNIFSFFF